MGARSCAADRFDRIDLFAGCTRRQRRRLDGLGTTVQRPVDTVLAVRGRVVDQAFLILDGAAVALDHLGAATLRPGDLVGATELGARRRHPRTVLVSVTVRLEVFTVVELRDLLEQVPALRERVTAVAATVPGPDPPAPIRSQRARVTADR